MRRHAAVPALALLLFAVACSRGVAVESESPAPLDPVGAFDYAATVNGQTRTGTFVIEPAGGGYDGYITLEGEPESAPMSNIRVAGQRLTFDASPPGESFTFDVTFTGPAFSGQIVAPVGSIPVTGARQAD